jgi:Polyketide cyclase / dehydrase and lipid transport
VCLARFLCFSSLFTPLTQVWAVIGKFDTMQDWHVAITSTEMTGSPTEVGSMRKMIIGNGSATVYEDLTAQDSHSYSYRFSLDQAAPFAINDYQAILCVKANESGSGSTVRWSASWSVFDGGMSVDESTAAIAGVFRGIDGVKQRLDAM